MEEFCNFHCLIRRLIINQLSNHAIVYINPNRIPISQVMKPSSSSSFFILSTFRLQWEAKTSQLRLWNVCDILESAYRRRESDGAGVGEGEINKDPIQFRIIKNKISSHLFIQIKSAFISEFHYIFSNIVDNITEEIRRARRTIQTSRENIPGKRKFLLDCYFSFVDR